MTTIDAFTSEHVSRLTGLSARQLTYWDKTGFFAPAHHHGRRAYGRLYSFRDVVGLRAIGILRNQHHISLQVLRMVGQRLSELDQGDWHSVTLWVSGKNVFFGDSVRYDGRSGQPALQIAMAKVESEVRHEAERLLERTPDQIGRVMRNRYLVGNAPVLQGTRVPTSAIWAFHQAGFTVEEIIREYPALKPEDVSAAIAYEEAHRTKQAG